MTMNLLRSLSIILLPSVLAANTTFAAAKPKNDYISRYLDIALMEKARSGIPVAITIAQGIYESAWGESRLATEAQNHFGIKCGKDWQGPSFAQKDDDVDSTGNLIESCFRKYDSPENSYIDHTDFLMSRPRYEFLFGFSDKDYISWAKGLKQAGYATNPEYANRLIKIIEDYELYKYDGLAYPLIEEETPFSTNAFETPNKTNEGETHSLENGELWEMEPGKIKQSHESGIEVEGNREEEKAKKSEKIPDGYRPKNVKKKIFDLFFSHKEDDNTESKNNEDSLPDITPQRETFRSKGIADNNDGYIINEFKVKNKFWLKN